MPILFFKVTYNVNFVLCGFELKRSHKTNYNYKYNYYNF